MNRRHLLLGASALTASLVSLAWAGTPAEDFVAGNIQRGFDILNDRSLDAAARRERFAAFVIGLTDVRRVALFLLGDYAAKAAPADLDAYVAAYQDYILSVYQIYFAQYAGQSLRVVSSRERAPGDVIVTTTMVGGSAPTMVQFRIRTDGAKPELLDLNVADVWLAVAQRAEFTSVLAKNNGDVKALTAHLRAASKT